MVLENRVWSFANDNSCMFVFDFSGFCIKDKATRNMLFRWQSENGLHPFLIRMLPTHSNKDGPAAFVGKRVITSICHSQLEHLASAAFQHLASAFQLPVDGSPKLSSICTPCHVRKSKKLSFFNFLFHFIKSIRFNILWSLGFFPWIVNKWVYQLCFLHWWALNMYGFIIYQTSHEPLLVFSNFKLMLKICCLLK